MQTPNSEKFGHELTPTSITIMHMMFEQFIDGISWTDMDGYIQYANPAWIKTHGYDSLDQLIGKHLSIFHTEDQLRQEVEPFIARLKQTSSAQGKMGHKRKDGTTFRTLMSSTILKDEKNKPVAMIAVARDITALERAEREYQTIVRTAMDGFWITDLQGRFLDVNDAYCQLIGYRREELLSMSISNIEAEEKREETAAHIEKIRQSGGDRFETRHCCKDGKIIDIEVSVNYLDVEDGRLCVFLRDITARKKAEQELKQHRDQLEQIVEVRTSELKKTNEQLQQEITERRCVEQEVIIMKSRAKLKRVFEELVNALGTTIAKRDPYTANHQLRVTQLACAIARQIGLAEEQIEGIRVAGLLHDIGKIYVPAEILAKPSGLSKPELDIVRTHPSVAYDILSAIEFPWPVARIVLQHHERLDGSGYPQGLKGEAIILEARVMGVADVVEAMTAHRPYRPARGLKETLDEIIIQRGILYDAIIVDTCVKLFNEQAFAFADQLSYRDVD